MTNNELLSDRLANARAAKGLSEQQLALRMGVEAASIEAWESGKHEPRANRLNQLSGVLNVPLTWLVAGNDTPAEAEFSAFSPNFAETKIIQEKLDQAAQLVDQLSFLLVDIRSHTSRVQREIDAE